MNKIILLLFILCRYGLANAQTSLDGAAIDVSRFAGKKPGAGNATDDKTRSIIRFDDVQIGVHQRGASAGLNPETMGAGMTLIHKLGHTTLGGKKDDPEGAFSYDLGENERLSNQIRKEKGPGWGQSMGPYLVSI